MFVSVLENSSLRKCSWLVLAVIFGLHLGACSRTSPNSASDTHLGACIASGRGHFGKVQQGFVSIPISSDSIWRSVAHLERSGVLSELGLGLQDAWGAICEVVVQLVPSDPKPVEQRTVARKPTDI